MSRPSEYANSGEAVRRAPSQNVYIPLNEYFEPKERHKLINSQLLSLNEAPSLRELSQINDILHVDLGPQFEVDDIDLKVIFDMEYSPPFSPFSDDQEDDSDQSASCATSDPYSPTFDSLTSLIESSDYDPHPDFDFDAKYPAIFHSNPQYESPLPPQEFKFSPSLMSDGHDTRPELADEALDSSSATGDVVFDIFMQDLQSMIPGDDPFEFDLACLKEMDAKLLLAPREVFDEICWTESSQLHYDCWWKPLPDVPLNSDEDDDAIAELWHTENLPPDWVPLGSYLIADSSQQVCQDVWHPFATRDIL